MKYEIVLYTVYVITLYFINIRDETLVLVFVDIVDCDLITPFGSPYSSKLYSSTNGWPRALREKYLNVVSVVPGS